MLFYLFIDLAYTIHHMDFELSGKDQERNTVSAWMINSTAIANNTVRL